LFLIAGEQIISGRARSIVIFCWSPAISYQLPIATDWTRPEILASTCTRLFRQVLVRAWFEDGLSVASVLISSQALFLFETCRNPVHRRLFLLR